ncbi:hypothetical protein ACFX2I_007011 [Malus domestica]
MTVMNARVIAERIDNVIMVEDSIATGTRGYLRIRVDLNTNMPLPIGFGSHARMMILTGEDGRRGKRGVCTVYTHMNELTQKEMIERWNGQDLWIITKSIFNALNKTMRFPSH